VTADRENNSILPRLQRLTNLDHASCAPTCCLSGIVTKAVKATPQSAALRRRVAPLL
jgi:hypothetical protein